MRRTPDHNADNNPDKSARALVKPLSQSSPLLTQSILFKRTNWTKISNGKKIWVTELFNLNAVFYY